jgi:hypothetical protein
MYNTTEIIRNCNKEELMEIINAARNLDDYEQSTDSEILQALINGSIQIEWFPFPGGLAMRHQLSPSKHQFGASMCIPIDQLVRLPDVVSQIITKQQNCR